MSRAPYRLALVGIDGSGKTAVITRLRQLLGAEGEVVTMHSPAFHENPNAPLQLLSRQMREVSLAADRLGTFTLKVTMLYLQMTLYGAVERCMVQTFRPACVLSDRHALVDTLAYGTIYKGLALEPLNRATIEPLLRDCLCSPDALDATIAWQQRLERRLGGTTGFWDLALDLDRLFDRPPQEILTEFMRRYDAQLPDAVVLLDVDPAEALRRSADREEASSELHEDPSILEALRDIYEEAIRILEESRADVALHRIEGDSLSVDETLEAVLEQLPSGVSGSLQLQFA